MASFIYILVRIDQSMSVMGETLGPPAQVALNRTLAMLDSGQMTMFNVESASNAGGMLAVQGAPMMLNTLNHSTLALSSLARILAHPSLRLSLEETVGASSALPLSS